MLPMRPFSSKQAATQPTNPVNPILTRFRAEEDSSPNAALGYVELLDRTSVGTLRHDWKRAGFGADFHVLQVEHAREVLSRFARVYAEPIPSEEDEGLVEVVAEALHDAVFGRGSWDDYGTWTVDTDKQHEEHRRLARVALSTMDAHNRRKAAQAAASASQDHLRKALGTKADEKLCPDCRGEITSWYCQTCGNTGKVAA